MKDATLLRDYALRFVGLPYRWGGAHALTGFDCSGLVIELLTAAGVWPHGEDASAQGLFNRFQSISNWNTVDFGTLVFYGRSNHSITHVGFALDRFCMIEAGGGGSATTSFDAAKETGAVIRIRPINYRRDLVASLMPQYAFYVGEK